MKASKTPKKSCLRRSLGPKSLENATKKPPAAIFRAQQPRIGYNELRALGYDPNHLQQSYASWDWAPSKTQSSRDWVLRGTGYLRVSDRPGTGLLRVPNLVAADSRDWVLGGLGIWGFACKGLSSYPLRTNVPISRDWGFGHLEGLGL